MYKVHLGKVVNVQSTLRESGHCTKYIKGKWTLHKMHIGKVVNVQNTLRESAHCSNYIKGKWTLYKVHQGKVHLGSVHCTKYI